MKKIILIFVFFAAITVKAQTVKTIAVDSNLITIITKIDSVKISLSEIDCQLNALDKRIDELTSELNRVEIRRQEYLNLKKKYFELIK